MWWLVFAAVDLYIGLVALDLLARSDAVPPEKLPRLAIAKKVVLVSLVFVGVALVAKIWR
ncbi:MAG: hypothetical protein LAO03_04035 [Acidobacteriia bacterium]|nr:hypothetical protein [Terriglobia bacterium]